MELDEIKILCVDDENNVLRALQRVFMDEDFDIFTANSGPEGLKIIEENSDILMIISDYRMPAMDGVQFLKQAYELVPNSIRIVLSGYADTAAVVSAINDGRIYKFIPKPWNDDELLLTIKEAIEVFKLKQKNELLADQLMGANDELTRLNSGLEEQISIRTEELEFQIRAMRFAHNVMNAMPLPVLGLTADGFVALANNKAEELFSNNTASPVGMNLKQLFSTDLQSAFQEVLETGHTEQEIIINSKPFFVRGTQLSQEEGQEGLVFILEPRP